MFPAADVAQIAPIFTALGDPTRLALVGRLCVEGPLSIARLADGATVTRQAITKHLDVLAGAGLVHGVRLGRERIWAVDPQRLDLTRRYLDRMSQRWDEVLERLRKFVED